MNIIKNKLNKLILLKNILKKSLKAFYTLFSDRKYSLELLKYLFKGRITKNIVLGHHKSMFFEKRYEEWRKVRINFLVTLLGENWFQNKKLIEFGSGNGEVSKFFSNIGANIICCEGREELVQDIKRRNQNFEIRRLDNDSDWNGAFKENQFDLAIHWGLLYHLENWESDLINTLKIAKIVCIESEVPNSDEEIVSTRKEFGHDQAIHNIGSSVSSRRIENIFHKMNFKFKRYDSKKLNTTIYKYDWKISENEIDAYELRRFWLVWSD